MAVYMYYISTARDVDVLRMEIKNFWKVGNKKKDDIWN